MAQLIFFLIVFVALAAMYEGWRRSARAAARRAKDESNRLITADEDLPSETGRYRVQEMLKRTAQRCPDGSTGSTPPEHSCKRELPDEQRLPDPFSESKH